LGRAHSFVEGPGLSKKEPGPSRKEPGPSRKELGPSKKEPGPSKKELVPNRMELVERRSLIGVLGRGIGERGANSWADHSSVEWAGGKFVEVVRSWTLVS